MDYLHPKETKIKRCQKIGWWDAQVWLTSLKDINWRLITDKEYDWIHVDWKMKGIKWNLQNMHERPHTFYKWKNKWNK